ncbi:hypothetical protein [Sphingomonas sp. BAUL-RG-20F-R05-02]|uniref:hypothetical protein n=1 Tax=Sphingomonas sp. BAUL-RG-20F-R05-02 TaxID=2914830 RepID=UPI001F573CB3|nr:hypothetical protein [Sphingomonas sp. BAUL-RG-20F-R05-02]
MSINSSSGLIGLSLLSGDTSLFASANSSAAATSESLAVRKAKAQFTLAATTPPWKAPASKASDSAQVATVKAMKTIIDATTAQSSTLPDDVKTSFTAYKALDSLRILAQAATAATLSDSQRASIDKSFAKGLADLQTYLGTAPTSKLDLAFAQPTRRGESETLPSLAANTGTVTGSTVAAARDAALTGMTGSEQFSIAITSGSSSATVHVDLAGTQQPPTLDSVAAAINAAIAAIPAKNADGTVALDDNGDPKPLYSVKFAPVKNSDGWTMGITAPRLEQVAITQDNAPDALMISVGSSALDAPSAVRMLRFDDPANNGAQHSYDSVTALDTDATARAALLPSTTVAVKGVAPPPPAQVNASLTANASVTAPDGSTYVVGTAAGDVGGQTLAGSQDLLLTKRDSEGKVVWERMLGAAGSATGAAVSLAPNGDVVVAGTVTGSFDTQNSDGDVVVSRYNATGEEQWSTLVRANGADTASAITTAPDGSIYVGGRAASGDGDAFVARLDGNGRLQERRVIDSGGSDGVSGLAVDGDGNVLALMHAGADTQVRKLQGGALSTDLGQISLGTVEARAIAVGADGTVAVAGAASAAVAGTQTNAMSGGRDGFVTLLDPGLTSAATSYVGTAADDQIDSIAFDGTTLYAGGRTTGTIGATKTGSTDGFVVGIDTATGAVGSVRQFGQLSTRTDSVQVSTAKGGASALGAIGLKLGVQGAQDSTLLTANTSLRAGDEFSIQVEGGAVRKVTIAADDTLTSLASRINRLTGGKITVSTPKVGSGNVLRIEAKAGASVELIAGATGKDALAKLGLPAKRLTVSDPVPTGAPKVRPGGTYGLGLSSALRLDSVADAKAALGQLTSALSITQTAYRSLYWDATKAATVDGPSGGGSSVSAYDKAKLASYTDALARLTG